MPQSGDPRRRRDRFLDSWKTWRSLTIKVDGLPDDVTADNLLEWFSPEGNIALYNIIPASADRTTPPCAFITFEPVPSRAFWEVGSLLVDHPDTNTYPMPLRIPLTLQGLDRWRTSRFQPEMEYPSKMTARLFSLGFGSLVDPTSINIRKTIDSTDESIDFSIDIDIVKNRLLIFFPVITKVSEGHFATKEYKIVAEISQLKTVYHIGSEHGREVLVFPFQLPPQYFWKNQAVQRSMPASRRSAWGFPDAWTRATDIGLDTTIPLVFPVAAHNNFSETGYMDIGRWTAFRFVLKPKDGSAKQTVERIKLALEDLNIGFEVCHQFHVGYSPTTMWDHLDNYRIDNQQEALALLQLSELPFVHLDFGVRYQLEVCVTRGMLNEHRVSLEFLQKLAALNPFDAQRRLELLVDGGKPMYDPMELLKWNGLSSYAPQVRIPHYCVMARKAAITPTTMRLTSPTVETSNRVLRYFNPIHDRFLRVQFVEESENGRIAMSSRNKDDIWKRMLRTLYEGIQIGDRRYEFLAFGSSQLRQCGCYFFCPTDHISCDDIRRWMGDVGHIKVVAKYAARLGQCFSTTREMKGLPIPDVRSIPDIERNGYCFTDGVGIISEFMAQMIIEEMTMEIFNEPVAFQFRMGGCKGVLVVWPQAKRGEVYIRESQEKFKAELKSLEIIKCAKFSTATLNRQTITILESLGVKEQAFMTILERQIALYEEAIKDNDVAIDMLRKCVDENQSTLVLAELLQAGFKSKTREEPFVMNLLHLWRSWCLKLLKEKARIPVEKSAFVLGCVDETGTLRGHSNQTEGSKEKNIGKLPQIFLQVSGSKIYDKTTTVEGVCIVGRNPSLHPGDIRLVEAVNVPQLRHLKDVVVFPSKGDRPVPNMLSGGDLDGDDFFVIWEPTLIPPEWNHPPMNYSSPKPPQLYRDVNVDDLRDFFVKYMKNDVLPLIATAHLAHADRYGARSPICKQLAELHSQAVDYPKTGEPAEWNPAVHNPQEWPHFMEKKHTYNSQKALGVVYNRVIKQSIQFRPDWDHDFDERILNRFDLDHATLDKARGIKKLYDGAVRRILMQQNLETEFELYTSWAMTKPPIGSEYKRQEELGKEFDAIKQRFRDMCFEAAGGHDEDQFDHFAAAMYKVTEQEMKIALFEHYHGPTEENGAVIPPRKLDAQSMPLISFPWIFPWVMIRIASGGKFNPKKSILAAAHRYAPTSSIPKMQQPIQDTEADLEVLTGEVGRSTLGGENAEDTLVDLQEEEEASQGFAALDQIDGFEQV